MQPENHLSRTKSPQREAFALYLRTGRRPDIEFKFNPYHDPRNGRFTFAPGGPRSLSHVVISDKNRPATDAHSKRDKARPLVDRRGGNSDHAAEKPGSSAQLRRDAKLLYPGPRGSPPRRGGNIRAFWDPMTLQEAFPGLANPPAGAILSVADNLFDITGPASALTASLTQQYSSVLIRQIRAIDPDYRFDSLGRPSTLEGQVNQINRLRLHRAAALYRVRGETGALQVEALRYLQPKVDAAYEMGLRMLEAGRLSVRLSPREAVGNYIDREMRRELRELYNSLGIASGPGQQVRVVGREYDSSASELTYRIPDARIGNLAIDVTLTQKTLSTAQVRGFFNSYFRPSSVVIVRPRQSGPNSTYIITRPRS